MSPPLDHGAADLFYATPLGVLAAEILRVRLGQLWPDLAGQSVLGLGYPAPYLNLWRGQAYACLCATTSHHVPHAGGCAIDALRLPFPDLVFDRVLVIHGVEPVGQDAKVLREIWRVLKDDGRMLVVAPNRTGLWAHADSTPFGQGQPYSSSQLNRLLAAAMFRAERQDTALYTPPGAASLLRPIASLCEAVGHMLVPQLAGVTITEAVKDTYAALPVTAPARRQVIMPEAA